MMQNFSQFLQESSLETLNIWDHHPSKGVLHVSGLNLSAESIIIASRFLKNPENIVIVTKDYKSSEEWLANLSSLVSEENIRFFPSIGLKPYEEKVPFDGVLEERLLFFRDIQTSGPLIVICPIDALLMKLPAPGFLKNKVQTLKVGSILDPKALRPILLDMGFKEQPIVSAVGEFSIRGCIVDINGFLYEHPVRIEFFGDEIESIRSFDIFTQRSLDTMTAIDIYPMGEFNIAEKDKFHFAGDLNGYFWKRSAYESLTASIFDYLTSPSIVFDELSSISEYASSLRSSYDLQFLDVAALQFKDFPPEKIWWNFTHFSSLIANTFTLDFTRVHTNASNWIHYDIRTQSFESSGIDHVLKEIEEFTLDGGRVYIVAPTSGALHRLQHLFHEVEIEGFLEASLSEGFWLPEEKVAFLTETRIFNRHSKKSRKKMISGSVSNALLVETLSRGDLVAHEDHGVGRYLGLVRVEVNGGLVDCALLEYQGGDRLKFPVADLQKIEKLQTPEDGQVQLNRLGSKAFENLKKRVKQKVIQIAKELVELYAKRELTEGFPFPPDNKLQEEFEESFEYEPTPDQVNAVLDIKKDMESKKPMDRLICGDVGFGKTEVAMRAAFKCILSKKQVVVLVPTTILAAQHYENFRERFAAFPVNIDLVNRYRSVKDKKEVFEKLKKGAIDIVIGTHSLLSQKIEFKDLGLLIVDEEQKFGVKQKELLREMRLSVDTLSMSATPIPRSLHLSMTGVRDISLINTPPMNRLPVETKLLKRNDVVLAQAVKDELARGGQVFIVNDRVQNILQLADDVESWVPEARVGVAHGQMADRDLERVMEAFISREFDILVSTSIIESGLDVPNANTIIIMNSHHFGISQLYQMRGRVGRSDVLAHAYLVTPAKGEISVDSAKRLQALEQFTDLGSGYQLAMRDLEIRGAGNLLGSEQHGFIAEIGFETYVRLVKEAVELIRGGTTEKPIQPRIEIGVDAYLPEDWIEDGLTRITLYQRLARITSELEIKSIREEIQDRFGPIPEPAEMLFIISEISLYAGRLRIQGVQQRRGMLAMTFAEFPAVDPKILAEIISLSPYPMRYLGSTPLQAVVELGRGDPIALAKRVHESFKAFDSRTGG